MKYTNIANKKSINEFVYYKLSLLEKSEVSFKSLFELMFSEKENTFYEYHTSFNEYKITYQQAYDDILHLAASLKKTIKLEKNSIVGLYLDNDINWIKAFWAILYLGYRPLLLNLRFTDEVINKLLKDIDCHLVISNGKKFDVETIEYKKIELVDDKVESDFANEIFFLSSGTTSNIKVCAYSSKEIFNIIVRAKDVVLGNKLVKKHYNGELKLLMLLPLYHIFGFVALYVWFAFFSRTFVELLDMSPKNVLDTINRHNVTHIFAVPLFWNKIYESAMKEINGRGEKTAKKFEKGLKISNKLGNTALGRLFRKVAFKEVRDGLFFDHVNFCISGGSNIDRRVLSFFNGIGYHLTNGYGSTEIGITSFELSNKYKYLNNASIGKPLRGYEYKINEEGELLVKGNSISKYIITGKEKVIYDGGYFNTHDLMAFKDGRYYANGRKDDLIIPKSGENINPNLIEEKLKINGVNELCLIKDKDDNSPILLVEVNKYLSEEKAKETLSNIKNKIVELGFNNQIGQVVIVKDNLLDKDDFKINRTKVMKKYYANAFNVFSNESKSSSGDIDEITSKVKELFSKALGKEVNEIEADFFLDLGGSSLDYFTLVSDIHEEFGVDIYSANEFSLSSIKAISDYIKSKL